MARPEYGALSVTELVSLVTWAFDLLTLKLVRVIAHWVGNLPTNFCVSETIRSNTCQTL